ncbi:MAG: hypothetical protein PF542_04940 [Nanoarchaeota archaeon]|jgi:hypothetical protein|nr:hypothetical protein [Nanoarchaeota archaeon]
MVRGQTVNREPSTVDCRPLTVNGGLLTDNKKGMLLAEETMKIIIAVICVGFLIYLLSSIYFATSGERNLEDAKKTIDKIKDIAPLLTVESPARFFPGLGPGGWYVYSFTQAEDKPNQCSGQDCICICDSPYIWSSEAAECSKSGECVVVGTLVEMPDIEILKDGSTNMDFFKDGDKFGVVKK